MSVSFYKLVCAGLLGLACAHAATEVVDVHTEDLRRFGALLDSPRPERQVEGIQGLSYLKHWPSEERLIPMLAHEALPVRREAVMALGRLGTAKSIPALIKGLRAPEWELRQNAALALARMTAQSFPASAPEAWEKWWQATPLAEKRQALLAELTTAAGRPPERRRALLQALRHLAEPPDEAAVLKLLPVLNQPPLTVPERNLIGELFERIGSTNAIPLFAAVYVEDAAWALGRIGGPDAERILLRWPKTLPVLINLDRLQSTNAGPLAAGLIRQMGLVTYRSQPDDLFLREPQPIQRVAANLLLRSGQAPKLIELIVRELEETMSPPLANGPKPAAPPELAQLLAEMREELKPGFVRNDGVTTSQPLTAMYFIARDPALAPRLAPLLRHPALVPRVYVAMTLGRLQARETAPELIKIIREGYAFSDTTALASGKHFDQSQTVRWRGFLCLALGRMGGEEARLALEQIAVDPAAYRDLRYGAVVGLGFIGSPKSLPVLEAVARQDIVWMVRDTAREAVADIALMAQEGGARK